MSRLSSAEVMVVRADDGAMTFPDQHLRFTGMRNAPPVQSRTSTPEQDPRRPVVPLSLKRVHADTWDLSDPKARDAYCKLKQRLYAEAPQGYAKLIVADTKFVEAPHPRWVAYIEWHEYAHRLNDIWLTPAQCRVYHLTGVIPQEALTAHAEQSSE